MLKNDSGRRESANRASNPLGISSGDLSFIAYGFIWFSNWASKDWSQVAFL